MFVLKKFELITRCKKLGIAFPMDKISVEDLEDFSVIQDKFDRLNEEEQKSRMSKNGR